MGPKVFDSSRTKKEIATVPVLRADEKASQSSQRPNSPLRLSGRREVLRQKVEAVPAGKKEENEKAFES